MKLRILASLALVGAAFLPFWEVSHAADGSILSFGAHELLGGSDPAEPGLLSVCEAEKPCTEMADENNGIGCPTVFLGVGACQDRTCAFSCESNRQGELCENAFDTCEDTTIVDSPGVCGPGVQGHCTYTGTPIWGTGLVSCVISTNCTSDAISINCGVVRTCD